MNANDLLTPDDVAQALDCTPQTVSAKLAARELPGVKIGRSWRIPRAALIEHLNEQARGNVRSKGALAASVSPAPAAVCIPPAPKGRREPPALVSLSVVHAMRAAKSSPRSEA